MDLFIIRANKDSIKKLITLVHEFIKLPCILDRKKCHQECNLCPRSLFIGENLCIEYFERDDETIFLIASKREISSSQILLFSLKFSDLSGVKFYYLHEFNELYLVNLHGNEATLVLIDKLDNKIRNGKMHEICTYYIRTPKKHLLDAVSRLYKNIGELYIVKSHPDIATIILRSPCSYELRFQRIFSKNIFCNVKAFEAGRNDIAKKLINLIMSLILYFRDY